MTLTDGGPTLWREHVVQFYDSDDVLADRVARYLGQAIEADGVAIIIATEAHRVAFEARMAELGVDVADAWSRGTLLCHDAYEAMETLLAGGDRPDPAVFDRLIGNLVRYASRRGGPVRGYGEIVALMVDSGYVQAAMELEQLWNDLQRQLPFSLSCAYPTDTIGGEERVETRRQICHLHTHIEIDAELPAGARLAAS